MMCLSTLALMIMCSLIIIGMIILIVIEYRSIRFFEDGDFDDNP